MSSDGETADRSPTGTAGAPAVAASDDAGRAGEARRLAHRIHAQNRALRLKEQQLLDTLERLQEREATAARLAYQAQEESRKLAAALAELRQTRDALRAANEDLERRVAERTRALSEANEELQRVSRLKDEFLATLSHELRTPLNAILGWVRMLIGAKLDPATARKALEVIDRNAVHQARLIEDILDMSSIMAGKFRLAIRAVNPSEVVAAALDAVRPAAEAKEIELEATMDPEAGPVSADPDRLQQVVWNLATNAVKFTPRGGRVRVELRRAGSQVVLRVADSGQGIDPEFLPHVFERFRQADSSTTRRYGGLGLGLAVVRHLVEMHGGSVRADSEGVGKGATFTVTLPRRPHASLPAPSDAAAPERAAPERPEVEAPRLDGVRVLLVEDDEDARRLAGEVLRDRGAVVESFASAIEALAWLDHGRPDVLVSDLGMPEVDGHTFMRAIRARPEFRHLPAVAVSAYAGTPDREEALRSGFDDHIAKPVTPADLATAVAKVSAQGPRG